MIQNEINSTKSHMPKYLFYCRDGKSKCCVRALSYTLIGQRHIFFLLPSLIDGLGARDYMIAAFCKVATQYFYFPSSQSTRYFGFCLSSNVIKRLFTKNTISIRANFIASIDAHINN